RDFDIASVSGKSVSSIQNERLDSRTSRRDFLKAAGVIAAASLAAPPRIIAGQQPRIAIVWVAALPGLMPHSLFRTRGMDAPFTRPRPDSGDKCIPIRRHGRMDRSVSIAAN